MCWCLYLWCVLKCVMCVMHSASLPLLQKIRVLPAVGKDPETQRSEMIRVSLVYLLPSILNMHIARGMKHPLAVEVETYEMAQTYLTTYYACLILSRSLTAGPHAGCIQVYHRVCILCAFLQ